MELNKETLKQARRAPTPATHRAVLSALDVLDMQPIHKPFALPRWAVAVAAAAAVVMLVAAVPPLRHRATNLALDVLGQAIPQADRVNPAAAGKAPLPSAKNTRVSMFSRLSESPYPELPAISQIIGTSQTVNGITATVEEAALTVDKLYLAMRVTNAPRNSDISNTISIRINRNDLGFSSAHGTYDDSNQEHLFCVRLETPVRTPGTTLPVSLNFEIKEISAESGQEVDGATLGSFSLDFTVTAEQPVPQVDDPANAYVTPTPAPSADPANSPQSTDLSLATAMAVPTTTTAAAEITAMPSSELPTPRPSSNEPATTTMPSLAPQTTAPGVIMPDVTWAPPAMGGADTKALSPSSVDLPEIAGTTYHEVTQFNTGIILEMPDTMKEWDSKAWMKADIAMKTDILFGMKGDTGSFYICVGEYDIQNDLWKAANYVANQWSGEVNGQLYITDGLPVVLMEDPKGQLACIVLLPSDVPYKMNIPADIVNVNGDTITIWGTPAYIHHALKTMRFDSSTVKWISKS